LGEQPTHGEEVVVVGMEGASEEEGGISEEGALEEGVLGGEGAEDITVVGITGITDGVTVGQGMTIPTITIRIWRIRVDMVTRSGLAAMGTDDMDTDMDMGIVEELDTMADDRRA
jgi:hypothetical protein